jgi:hypothetical protein
MKRRIAIALILFGGALCAADDLPKAETLLDKYVEVTGGKAAYAKVHNDVSTGTMSMGAMGLSGKMIMYRQAPNKGVMDVTIEGIGKITEGSNGDVAWSMNAMQGPRLKEGDEKIDALRSTRYNADAEWRTIYDTVETVGVESVDGKDAYKVVLTPKAGKPLTKWIDKQSNLVVKTAMTSKSPMGEIPVESSVGDYRKEGDILVPHKMVSKVAGQELTITIDKVDYNAEIPKDKFDPPAEVKALIKPAK